MNQSPLKKCNENYTLTFKGISEITELTKPVFYELENFNENWSQLFIKDDIFDNILEQNLKNDKFRALLFTDEFASTLLSEIEDSSDFKKTEIFVQFNNFVYDIFYGNSTSVTSSELKRSIARIDPDISFATIIGANEGMSILCNGIFSLFPKKLEFYRGRDSVKFKREMKEIEIEIKDLKEQFFVKEITEVFTLPNAPDHLLFALKAIAFVLTDRFINWDDKGFTIKEICDFLLRMKPWDITKKQRKLLKRDFFKNELWDMNKIAKQSQTGVIMARWLEANVEAAELIDNVKTQSKSFKISEDIHFDYFRLPGGCNWAVARVKLGLYPPRGNLLTFLRDELRNNLKRLKRQGFKNKYLNPKWVLVVSEGGFTMKDLEAQREDQGLFLGAVFTGFDDYLRHEVTVNHDTGYLRIMDPETGHEMRIQDLGVFRVTALLWE